MRIKILILISLALALTGGAIFILKVSFFSKSTDPLNPQIKEGTYTVKPGSSKDFNLENWDGNNVRLSDLFKNSYVLVNFWATWCPPCVAEIPSMIQFTKDLKNKPIKMATLNVGEDWNTIKAFYKKMGGRPPFLVLSDKDENVSAQWRISKFPETYLIAPGGTIIDKFIGPVAWDQSKLTKFFNVFLHY